MREPKVGDEIICITTACSCTNKGDLGKIIKVQHQNTIVNVQWYKNGEVDWYDYPGISVTIDYSNKLSTNKIKEITKAILEKIERL